MNFSEKLSTRDVQAVLNKLNIGWRNKRPAQDGWITIKSPIRDEHDPSFGLNIQTGIFKDHGSGDSGDIVTLTKLKKNLNTSEAIYWIKEHTNIIEWPDVQGKKPERNESESSKPRKFWQPNKIARLKTSQAKLIKNADHEVVNNAIEYDRISHKTLRYFGCGIILQHGKDWLAFPYETGCQLYRREDGAKLIRALKGSSPSDTFFGTRKIDGRSVTLSIAKSPRECMLLNQLNSNGSDVVGLATGEQGSLSNKQNQWLSEQISESEYLKIHIYLDCDTESAYLKSKKLAHNIGELKANVEISIVNTHKYTQGACKDVTDLVKSDHFKDAIPELIKTREIVVKKSKDNGKTVKLPEIDLDVSKAPAIPKVVYEHLPETLKTLCNMIEEEHRRDVFLVSALPVIAAHLPNVLAAHVDGYYSPDLFTLVVAGPGTGKGTASKAKKLGKRLNQYLIQKSKDLRENYLAMTDEQQQSMDEPKDQSLFIPANSSSRAIYDSIEANGGSGLLFETEIDTMLNATGQEWGNFSDITRKAFHHEAISINRKKEQFFIDDPRLSICITGTFDQFKNMFESAENGHFSRYALYTFDVLREWKSHRPTRKSRQLEGCLEDASEKLFNLYQTLNKRPKPLYIDLTDKQWDMVDDKFDRKMQIIDELDLSSYLHASNNRAAIIALRLASMFAVLRTFEKGRNLNEQVDSIEPSRSDLIAALWLADTFIKHAFRLYHILPKATDKDFKGERYNHFFEALPNEFETGEAVKIADGLDLSESTAKRLLSDWNDEFLVKIKWGYYRKATN